MYNTIKFLKNSLNGIPAKNRSRTTTTSCIGDVLEAWITKLEEYKIPDAKTSVQIIASSVLKIANVTVYSCNTLSFQSKILIILCNQLLSLQMDELPRFYSQILTEDQQRNIDQYCECRLAR